MLRAFLLALGLVLLAPGGASADDNVTARAHFDRGNDLLNDALRARGPRRERLLTEALAEYVESMEAVRSRNAVFNAAQVLEELGRLDEAFAHYTEYQRMPGVAPDAIADAGRRIDALRPRIAVVAITTTPAGASVYVDRRDLAPRGVTPVEIAMPAGEHTLTFVLEGFDEATRTVTAAVGQRETIALTMTARPVVLRIEAQRGRATVDGRDVELGADLSVAAGRHRVQLLVPGRETAEQTVDLAAGGPARVVRFDVPAPPPPTTGTLVVASDAEARVIASGGYVGTGRLVERELPAGSHQLEVTAYGYRPLAVRVEVRPGVRSFVRTRLEPDVDPGSTMGAWPEVLGVGAGIAGTVAIVLSVRAVEANDDFESIVDQHRSRAEQEEAADDVDDANVAADIGWAVTATLGVSALVLAILDHDYERRPSTATFAAAPIPQGAMVFARTELP